MVGSEEMECGMKVFCGIDDMFGEDHLYHAILSSTRTGLATMEFDTGLVLLTLFFVSFYCNEFVIAIVVSMVACKPSTARFLELIANRHY